MKDSRSPLPPLDAWVYTAGILAVCCMLAVPRLDPGEVEFDSPFADYNRPRVAALRDSEAAARVVMLGNSQLKYAVDDGRLAFTADAGGEAEVLRIVGNNAQIRDFGALLPEILDAKPDLLLIQAPLMLKQRSGSMLLRGLQAYARWRLFSPDAPFDPYDIDQQALQFDLPCSNDFSLGPLNLRKSRLEEGSAYSHDSDNALAGLIFVREAADAGIPVVLFSLPYHPTLAAEFDQSDYDELLAEYAQRAEVDTWMPAAATALDAEAFCDFVHVNERGRAETSAWLRGRIANYLNGSG